MSHLYRINRSIDVAGHTIVQHVDIYKNKIVVMFPMVSERNKTLTVYFRSREIKFSLLVQVMISRMENNDQDGAFRALDNFLYGEDEINKILDKIRK